jgi:ligand-binding SRPBCC domain-containing protein
MPTLTTSQTLRAPLDRVFEFFADAGNLEAITPPFLRFRIVTPSPIHMREGALIDYRLRLHGVPIRWRTRINAWEPPGTRPARADGVVARFIDEQIKGPYRLWVHEHTFTPVDGGTLVRDTVEYTVPMGFLVHSWFVRPRLDQIFAYRAEATRKLIEG